MEVWHMFMISLGATALSVYAQSLMVQLLAVCFWMASGIEALTVAGADAVDQFWGIPAMIFSLYLLIRLGISLASGSGRAGGE